MGDITCQLCRFFEVSDTTCRSSPPVRLPRKFAEAATVGNRVREETLIWGWPVIGREDWCGKWVAHAPAAARLERIDASIAKQLGNSIERNSALQIENEQLRKRLAALRQPEVT